MMISFVSMVFVLPAAAQHHHCSVLFSQIFFEMSRFKIYYGGSRGLQELDERSFVRGSGLKYNSDRTVGTSASSLVN